MIYDNPILGQYGVPQTFPGYRVPQMQQVLPPQKQVDKVNGRNGAMQYPVGPNSQAWILDENGLISWLILTDSAGYKTVTPYDVTPHEEKPAPDYGSLEERIKRLEDMIHDSEDFTAAGRRVKDSGAGKADDQPGQIRRPAGNSESAYADESEYGAGHADRAAIRRRFNESISGDR